MLEVFSQFSGYKLNLSKSELFPINTEALKLKYTALPLKVVTDHLSYLGVCFTRIFKNLFKSNFFKFLDQAKQILSKWSPLSFSLIGKINSIKMILVPISFSMSPHFSPQILFFSGP